jgi:hypothetical protein
LNNDLRHLARLLCENAATRSGTVATAPYLRRSSN